MRAVPGWMCKVDWDYELGEAAGGNTIFASLEDLVGRRKCVELDVHGDHTPQQVYVLDSEDFFELLKLASVDPESFTTSNLGPVIWSKENGWTEGYGPSK